MEAKSLLFFKGLFKEIKNIYQEDKNIQKMDNTLNNGDDVDRLSNEREKHLDLKLNGRKNFYLKKVETALEKIEDKTFGECEECEEEISMSRLKARPTACLCIMCKEEEEKIESHVLYSKKSHTEGKMIVNGNIIPRIGHGSESNVVVLNNLVSKQ